MSYNDDAVLSKLSALNETQEGIVTVSQWVMFHKRHAGRTAELWLKRLKEVSANRRLNLIYLANEVVQQSKARKKDDFQIAFSPIIAEAIQLSYRGSHTDIQNKIRRVVDVWRQRQVFDPAVLDAVEARIDEVDKTKSTGPKRALGGMGGSTSIPSELQTLVPLQQAVTKAAPSLATSVTNADREYAQMHDASFVKPALPVYAARLNGLLKNLANAESALTESVKARKAYVTALETLLLSQKATLESEEESLSKVTSRKEETEQNKQNAEDAIMAGLSSADDVDGSAPQESRAESKEERAPSVEALTPPGSPPPTGNPEPQTLDQLIRSASASLPPRDRSTSYEQNPFAPPPGPAPGSDLLSSLSGPHQYGQNGGGGSYPPPFGSSTTPPGLAFNSAKKRKLSSSAEMGPAHAGDDGMEGLDPEVAEMLRDD